MPDKARIHPRFLSSEKIIWKKYISGKKLGKGHSGKAHSEKTRGTINMYIY